MTDRPTSADILVAIAKVAATDWIDPTFEPIYWIASSTTRMAPGWVMGVLTRPPRLWRSLGCAAGHRMP